MAGGCYGPQAVESVPEDRPEFGDVLLEDDRGAAGGHHDACGHGQQALAQAHQVPAVAVLAGCFAVEDAAGRVGEVVGQAVEQEGGRVGSFAIARLGRFLGRSAPDMALGPRRAGIARRRLTKYFQTWRQTFWITWK